MKNQKTKPVVGEEVPAAIVIMTAIASILATFILGVIVVGIILMMVGLI